MHRDIERVAADGHHILGEIDVEAVVPDGDETGPRVHADTVAGSR
jgi:hypothetical protein